MAAVTGTTGSRPRKRRPGARSGSKLTDVSRHSQLPAFSLPALEWLGYGLDFEDGFAMIKTLPT